MTYLGPLDLFTAICTQIVLTYTCVLPFLLTYGFWFFLTSSDIWVHRSAAKLICTRKTGRRIANISTRREHLGREAKSQWDEWGITFSCCPCVWLGLGPWSWHSDTFCPCWENISFSHCKQTRFWNAKTVVRGHTLEPCWRHIQPHVGFEVSARSIKCLQYI